MAAPHCIPWRASSLREKGRQATYKYTKIYGPNGVATQTSFLPSSHSLWEVLPTAFIPFTSAQEQKPSGGCFCKTVVEGEPVEEWEPRPLPRSFWVLSCSDCIAFPQSNAQDAWPWACVARAVLSFCITHPITAARGGFLLSDWTVMYSGPCLQSQGVRLPVFWGCPFMILSGRQGTKRHPGGPIHVSQRSGPNLPLQSPIVQSLQSHFRRYTHILGLHDEKKLIYFSNPMEGSEMVLASQACEQHDCCL